MRNNGLSIFDPSRVFSDRFIQTFFDNDSMSSITKAIELNMYEDENHVVVEAKCPGFAKEDFDISIEDNVLTFSAEAKEEITEEDKKKKYYYKQISHSSFSRSVGLPAKVIADKAEAEYQDGILKVKMPKSEEVKPKKVSLKAN
jgi:HSP20 family protein